MASTFSNYKKHYRSAAVDSGDEQQMPSSTVDLHPGMMHILSSQQLTSSQEESKNELMMMGEYDQHHHQHLDLMFSPYNLQEKSRGALRLNHHQTANNLLIGPMSDGGNSASSFSGSG